MTHLSLVVIVYGREDDAFLISALIFVHRLDFYLGMHLLQGASDDLEVVFIR